MSLLGDRKPNIQSLSRDQDLDGLVAAAQCRDRDPAGRDLSVRVRAEAILALGALGPEAGREVVAQGLLDPADPVRCSAVQVLHARQEAAGLVRSLQVLPSGEGNSLKLARQAVVALRGCLDAAAVATTLIRREDEELLLDEDAWLVDALLDGGDPQSQEGLFRALVSALADDRGIVMDRAAELLVRLAPSSIAPVGAELRSGAAPSAAAWILGRIGDPDTIGDLMDGLSHTNERARAECASALGELGDPLAANALVKATRDDCHAVRVQAAAALDRLGTAAVIVGVAEMLMPALPHRPMAGDGATKGSHAWPPAKHQSRAQRKKAGGRPGRGSNGRAR